MRRIGVLMPSAADDPQYQVRVGAFLQELQRLGWIIGRNITIETRWTKGDAEDARKYGAELVALNPDLILASGISILVPLLQLTRTVPIVFPSVADPVAAGVVESLARPGGNATGFNVFSGEVTAKRLGLLHDLVPKAVRIAVLVNPANTQVAETTLRDIPEAARALGLQIRIVNASTSREIEAAFAALVRAQADALFVGADIYFVSRRVQLATLAAHYRIPAAYQLREAVEVGGLMSYGADRADVYRQVGVYTGQILKGAKPADLPVLQSSKFEFVINAQTARLLGIEVPNALQLLANEVIE